MTNLDRLLALGADVVAGELIWKNKSLGRFRHGEFFISDEGMQALNIENVEVKDVTPRAPRKRTRQLPHVEEAPVDVEFDHSQDE